MEEMDLIRRAKSGDQEAMTLLFNQYKPIIYSKTRQFFLIGGDRDDVMQEGMIGLLRAIKAYDESREASFKTFASLCIKRQVLTAIQNSNSNKNKLINDSLHGYYEFKHNLISVEVSALELHTPEDIFMCKELINGLKEFSKKTLSKNEYIIFELMLSGYSYVEISKKIEISLKSADNTMQRVKKKLREYIRSFQGFNN